LEGNSVNPVKKTFQYGRHQVTLETGEIARQADGAVVVNMDDTVVLVTVVAKNEVKPGQDFFPLTVDYMEKTYAAGRIPGGFFKREGKPTEKETLTSRLIDRPIRPLFPDGFFNEVQVIATVMSANPGSGFRHPRPDRRLRRPGPVRPALQRPPGRRPRGLRGRPVRAQPDPGRTEGIQARPGGGRHRNRRADGGIRGQGTARGRDAGRRGVRS
jgi:hypothetical protein